MNTARLNIINKKLLQNAAAVALVVSAAGCGVQHRVEADTLPAQYVNPFIGASTNIDAAGAYQCQLFRRQRVGSAALKRIYAHMRHINTVVYRAEQLFKLFFAQK